MSLSFNWEWIPNQRIGPFVFGQPIPKECLKLVEKLEPDCENADWETYAVFVEEGKPNVARAHVENGEVVTVEVKDTCSYLSRNLIGMKTSEVQLLVGGKWTIESKWTNGCQIDNDALGISIWDEDGVVESVTIGTYSS